MSYKDGFMAMNLEMPERVPRTEYSAHTHWDLVNAVTGLDINQNSREEEKSNASNMFRNAWNYDFIWGVSIHEKDLDAKRVHMGHAEYEQGGTDYNDKVDNPFKSPEEVFKIDFDKTYPRATKNEITKRFEDHWHSIKNSVDAVPTTGTYITLMSGMIGAFGWDNLLMAAGIDSKQFGRTMDRYTDWMMLYFEALAETDFPTVMIHDDIVWTSGPFLAPEFYREYIFPNYKKMFEPLYQANKIISYTSDGDYTMFVDDIADCGVNGFVMEPTTNMEYIAENYGKTHFFVGNADTRILLSGTRNEIENEVKRCMNIGKSCPGFIMAVGNHIPSNTPVENALWYEECYKKYSKR